MSNAAKLYAEIIPTFRGIGDSLVRQLVSPAEEAGMRAGTAISDAVVRETTRAGAKAGRELTEGVTGAAREAGSRAGSEIASGVTRSSATAGREAGKAITDGVVTAARSAGTDAGRNIASGVTTAAASTGTEAGREIATGVVSAARTAGTGAGAALAEGVTAAGATAGTEAGREIAAGAVAGGRTGGAEAGEAMASGVNKGAIKSEVEGKSALGEIGKSARELAEVMGAMWVTEKAVDFFKEGISGAEHLASVQRQTAAAIRSTGGAADVTAGEIKELTERLADESGKTDDVVQSALNILLTFPSVRNEVGRDNDMFDQASDAIVNLSARMGTDLRSSAVLVGKALNDPIKGTSALRRVGVQLTQQQADQVKEFVKSGETMKAQKVIVGELGREFAGSAAAAATPAERLHVAWDRLQVEVGQKLIPTVTRMANYFTNTVIPAIRDFFEWTSRNWQEIVGWGKAIGIFIITFWGIERVIKTTIAAWKTYSLVMEGVRAVMAAVTASEVAMDVAAESNPVGIIITAIAMAIALLVTGIYELVKHWTPIMHAMGDAAMWLWHNAIRPAWDGIRAAALFLWHNAIEPAMHGATVAVHALGDAANWLYRNVIHPVFQAISFAARLLAAILYTVLVTPVVLAWKYVLAPVFGWLYRSVIKPAFDLTGRIFTWLYHNVVQPVVAGIKYEIQWWGEKFNWLYRNAIKPAFDLIGRIFHWINENVIRPVVAEAKLELQWWGDKFNWLYANVIKPVSGFIGAVFSWLYRNIIKPIVAGIKLEIHAWAVVFQWIYDNVIKPVGHAIGATVHAIGQVFADVVDWIKKVWGEIENIAKVPINFVIKYVYNEGIRPVWNGIASVFGLGQLGAATPLAGGGVLPGYRPGHDSVHAMLSPGESVLVPELTAAIGPETILALNAAFSGRRPGATGGYSAGGVVPLAGGGVLSDIGGAISDAASWVWHGVTDAVDWVASIAGDIVGGVRSLFSRVTGWAAHMAEDNAYGADGGGFVSALQHIPAKVIDSVITAVREFFAGGGGHRAMIDAGLSMDHVARGDWGRWEAGMDTLISRAGSWNVANPQSIAYAIDQIRGQFGDISRVPSLAPRGYDGGGIVPMAAGRPPASSGTKVDIHLNGSGRSASDAAEIERRLLLVLK